MSREEDKAYWSSLWRNARRNMPRVSQSRMGSPTVLRLLLDYKINPTDRWPQGHGQHCNTAEDKGTRPHGPERQHILKMLAGPHGSTVARALAIKKGIDLSKYKVWPK